MTVRHTQPICPLNVEPYVTRKQLQAALDPYIPGCRSDDSFRRMLPYLPATILPGMKRAVYLISEVLASLRSYQITPPPPEERITSPLHRRRPRKSA